jgi:hypothetical protein
MGLKLEGADQVNFSRRFRPSTTHVENFEEELDGISIT